MYSNKNIEKAEELRELINDSYDREFEESIDNILKEELQKLNEKQVLQSSFSLMDLTTLHDDDNISQIENIAKESSFEVNNNKYKVAGICIYSNLLPLLNKQNIEKGIRKVVVSGGFPTGQLSLQAKLYDVAFAVENHADEIDIPINRGLFFQDRKELTYEIEAIKSIVRQNEKAKLKVILETSELKTYRNIYDASRLALDAGADFIKTSTGKVSRGADVYSAATMIVALKDWLMEHKDETRGFKAAGGIRTSSQVMQYYALMSYLLGEEFTLSNTFRIGCSNLKNEVIEKLKIIK